MNAGALGQPTINTIVAKPPHYTRGFYSIGSGPKHILILGSCRAVPYANYFHYLNNGNEWTVNLIDVVNFYFDAADKRVDQEQVLLGYEQKPELLDMLGKVEWFVHEHIANFGMLNTDPSKEKNIWRFMNPSVSVSLPNFNDLFILFQEQADFDPQMRERMRADIASTGALTKDTCQLVRDNGLAQTEKFFGFCRDSSLPDMERIMRDTWRNVRYWWTGSHITNRFTGLAMRLMCGKFGLQPAQWFWDRVEREDLYAFPRSPITAHDREWYGLQWPQPVEPLKIPTA